MAGPSKDSTLWSWLWTDPSLHGEDYRHRGQWSQDVLQRERKWHMRPTFLPTINVSPETQQRNREINTVVHVAEMNNQQVAYIRGSISDVDLLRTLCEAGYTVSEFSNDTLRIEWWGNDNNYHLLYPYRLHLCISVCICCGRSRYDLSKVSQDYRDDFRSDLWSGDIIYNRCRYSTSDIWQRIYPISIQVTHDWIHKEESR